ncbi:PREDICTED: uncharacterized protein LOC108566782 [Nicrophorus vespilloides]|uniref:Uncharacterized protein LOC108566782 n=1 Tax=Nicrophorus vespilloides TaxID=110193 RepID=A0ABM1N663_NICVS|nr:PREDICTED: uncharacterized protein LOC108566782 [Nicrophorus vespilloides]XP_017782314.1 PREDICTED: uncharacterized protein LOC108566782 [Nicrophorus vespilloides]
MKKIKFNDVIKEEVVQETKRISLRRNNDEDDDDDFNLSNDIQQSLSKQLSLNLDNLLEDMLVPDLTTVKDKGKSFDGVKLLSVSDKCIKVKSAKALQKEQTENVLRRKKRHMADLELDPDQYEKCKLVAVSYQDIVEKKDVQFWSNQTKAKVLKYKKDDKGDLVLQEDPFVSINYK